MSRVISVALLVAGEPVKKTILLIVGGAVASFVGLIGLAMPGGKR